MPEDQHKTAFVTKFGLFMHQRMAFGLCNAPGTFQCSMDYVLRDLLWLKVLVYLDDCLVIGETFESTLANLREVFKRFRKYNLKMKPKKCELFRKGLIIWEDLLVQRELQ